MLVSRRKLQPPPLPEPHLARPALVAAAATRRIACLSAPAGYGKTTVLVECLQAAPGRRAWYALDDADRDPTLLVLGLAAALGAPAPPADGPAALPALAPPALALASLCHWLEAQPAPVTLVLDDLQALADAPEALRLLSDLLLHAPDNAHLLLGGRALPPLPALPRLRLLGQVRDLGPGDLAFTPAESERLLASLGCDAAQTAALSRRAEGWPAALRLLAAVKPPAPAGDGPLFDYLLAEVLSALPPAQREFVLDCAVLPQWTPAACDFVRQQADSAAQLEALRRSRLLVTPRADGALLPHPVWLDCLRTELGRMPERRRTLERRAALWALQNDEAEAALHHALAAADPGLIAPLLRRVAAAHLRDGHLQRLQDWLEATPEAVLEQMPDLLLATGEALRRAGRPRPAVRWLHAAVLGYAGAPEQGLLQAVCRLALAHADLGDWAETEAALHQVEAELPGAGPAEQAEALLVRAVAQSAQGQWEAAAAGFREAASLFDRLGRPERAGAALVDLGTRALAGAALAAAAPARDTAGAPGGPTRPDSAGPGARARPDSATPARPDARWLEAALAALREASGRLDAATTCDARLAEAQLLLSLGQPEAAAGCVAALVPRSQAQQAQLCWLRARLAAERADLFAAGQWWEQGDQSLPVGERPPALACAALLTRGWLDLRSGNPGAALAAAERAAHLAAAAGAPLYAVAVRDLQVACRPAGPRAEVRPGHLQADLLGPFRVRAGGQELPPDAWGRAQVRGLLQFLLLQPDHAAGREAILEAFWPEADAEQSRGLLRVALYRLRKALQAAGCELEATPEVVRLPPGSVDWLDLTAFRAHLAAARRTVHSDPATCLEHCRSGRTLYRGDLLADAFWPWAEPPRGRVRRELAELLQLWQAAARSLRRDEEAVAALEEILTLEPGHEVATCELVRLLVAGGRRAEALRRYRELVGWLRSELGVDPAPETRSLIQRLLG